MPSSAPEAAPADREPSTRRPRPPRLRRARGLGRLLIVLVGVGFLSGLLGGFGLGALGLDFGGLELGGDQRVVLGAQVDLVGIIGRGRRLGGVLLDEIVLALELFDVAHADLQLMRDPGVGTTLSYPGADLV